MKKTSYYFVFVFVIFGMVSCKKNYQKLSTEFIRNLPDSCEYLVQVDNGAEHLVYYKEPRNNAFFCYNVEAESVEEIKVPKAEFTDCVPIAMGAGTDHIIVAYSDVEDVSKATYYSDACVQIYNLKTQSFKKLLECDGCLVDNEKNQLTCYTFETDRYGEGTRSDEIYDFDGKMLSKKDVELIDYEVVPDGTLAAKEQARIANEQQANRLSLWECILCHERIPSKGKPAEGDCPRFFGHDWRRISYLE